MNLGVCRESVDGYVVVECTLLWEGTLRRRYGHIEQHWVGIIFLSLV
jgi:hypothetical protein